ncbi:MAG: MFS transporter [Sphingopyxis sp.]
MAVAGIAAITSFASTLYYVFIVNCGIIWQEIGVVRPELIGKATALPSLFVVVGAVLFWAMGKMGLRARAQIAMFLVVLGAGLALIGMARTVQDMVIGMAVQQTGAGMAVPVLIAWAQNQLPFEHRGRGMGVWTSAFFFGQFTSPLIVNAARSQMGSMHGAFFAAGLTGIAGAVIIFALLSRRGAAGAETALATPSSGPPAGPR